MFDLKGLRVCFVAGTLGQGGAERQLYYMLRVLLERDAEPTVLCLTRGEYWESRIRALGVPVLCVGDSRSALARITRIAAALRSRRAAIVQSQHFYTNLYSYSAARITGTREIGAIRSDVANEMAANAGLAGRLLLRMPRRIAVNSASAIERAVAFGAERRRLHFLPNVVDVNAFRCERRGEPGTIRLLAVGRLGQVKRFDRFVRLIARLRQQSAVRIAATIIGDGPARQQLQCEAERLGLTEESCRFEGSVDDMSHRYADADILVLTSDHEGTPNVVIEAMASGLPVVATLVGGVPEIVKHAQTGILIDPENEDQLTSATQQLVCDRSLRERYGAAGRRFVAEHHGLSRLADALADLYEKTLNGRKRG